jgi:hypothetical protein
VGAVGFPIVEHRWAEVKSKESFRSRAASGSSQEDVGEDRLEKSPVPWIIMMSCACEHSVPDQCIPPLHRTARARFPYQRMKLSTIQVLLTIRSCSTTERYIYNAHTLTVHFVGGPGYVILPFKSIASSYYTQFLYSTLWIQLHVHKISSLDSDHRFGAPQSTRLTMISRITIMISTTTISGRQFQMDSFSQ